MARHMPRGTAPICVASSAGLRVADGLPNEHRNLSHWLAGFADDGKAVTVTLVAGQPVEGDALLGADGAWLCASTTDDVKGDAPR